jgi:hypothetical protein
MGNSDKTLLTQMMSEERKDGMGAFGAGWVAKEGLTPDW